MENQQADIKPNPTANWSDPLKVGDLHSKNRIMMAALTRCRCNPEDNVPTQMNAEYYAQRAGAGIILSEATPISQRGEGFFGSACLYNEKHAEGWKLVTKAVHDKGGLIVAQLVHAGRATHPTINKGLEAYGPSPLRRREPIRGLNEEYPIPKEMTLEDIQQTKNDYRKAFLLAKEAGFDGVQIHAAHGYLLDSFIKSSSNQRKDEYGGSIQNRCRLVLEIVDAVIEVFGAGRVGLKLSPVARVGDVMDDNPLETFSYLLKELDKRHVAFIELRGSNELFFQSNHFGVLPKDQMENVCRTLKPFFKGVFVANNNLNPTTGLEIIRAGEAEMVSFGRLYIVNPDFAERIINGHPFEDKWDMKLFYGHELGAKGYTDYPCYNQQK